MSTSTTILVTEENYDRLRRLIDQHSFIRNMEAIELLDAELSRAEIVATDQIPPRVVTMNSRILFEELDTGMTRIAYLAYPTDRTADSARVSILAPIGIALLGLAEGQTIEFPMPGGRAKQLRVLQVLFQPEAMKRPPPRAA